MGKAKVKKRTAKDCAHTAGMVERELMELAYIRDVIAQHIRGLSKDDLVGIRNYVGMLAIAREVTAPKVVRKRRPRK